jgi:hypothetical protein
MTIFSMDWFKGKITGKHHISWENLWFPVDFPLNQSIDFHPFLSFQHHFSSCRSACAARIQLHGLPAATSAGEGGHHQPPGGVGGVGGVDPWTGPIRMGYEDGIIYDSNS